MGVWEDLLHENLEEDLDCLERDCSSCPLLPYCDVGPIFVGLTRRKEASEK
mgnify:CR=1 FL=1